MKKKEGVHTRLERVMVRWGAEGRGLLVWRDENAEPVERPIGRCFFPSTLRFFSSLPPTAPFGLSIPVVLSSSVFFLLSAFHVFRFWWCFLFVVFAPSSHSPPAKSCTHFTLHSLVRHLTYSLLRGTECVLARVILIWLNLISFEGYCHHVAAAAGPATAPPLNCLGMGV